MPAEKPGLGPGLGPGGLSEGGIGCPDRDSGAPGP